MAVEKNNKTSRTVLIVCFIVTIIVLGIFYFGGQVPEAEKLVAGTSQPKHTDLLLYLCYAMLIVTVVVWLLFAIVGFVRQVREQPKKAVGGLVSVVALAAMLIITYVLGSGETLIMPGYEGSENTPFYLKLTDMWLYSCYIMLVLTVLAMVVMPFITRRR